MTLSTDGHPRYFWPLLAIVLLSAIYLALQAAFVRPFLWPGGHGVAVAGESIVAGSSARPALFARPPDAGGARSVLVEQVLPESEADRKGVKVGDRVVALRHLASGQIVDLAGLKPGATEPIATPSVAPGFSPAQSGVAPGFSPAKSDRAEIAAWREAYRIGLRGTVVLELRRGAAPDAPTYTVQLERPAVWSGPPGALGLWARRHLGILAQIVCFTGGAAALLVLRSRDATAALAVLALALCAVGGGGPLAGAEHALPPGLREAMTVFAWIAAPIAFPLVALAILYFPTRAALVSSHPWLQAVPFVAAAPMIALATLTGLYLAGLDAAEGATVWDARHPWLYFLSAAAALAINVVAIVEGVSRYRGQTDPDEVRRIRLVVYTTVPAVLAYAVKDGLPMMSMLASGRAVELPWALNAFLQALVVLPAFTLTYAVAVHRVLGPRLFLRSSMQYALARQTLAVIALLPALALALSLVRQRDMTLAMIVRGNSVFYIVTIGLALATMQYREMARVWLDRRFFREQYDAREILLSLASRISFETDPHELTALVINRIDQALHPDTIAVLATGLAEGRLAPLSALRVNPAPLRLDSGLVSVLRWSDEPLEIDLADPRSPLRRLPAADQDWLKASKAALLVPVNMVRGADRATVAVITLGRKLSEEPYTADDRQLLASIAAQAGLALDVARLRGRALDAGQEPTSLVTSPDQAAGPLLVECVKCGRADEAPLATCPEDGAPMKTAMPIPRVIDRKYRIDRVIGRGGMGAVYRARDVRLDRDVALKVVRAELLGDPEARTRFRREAQIVARLQHPSIVSIFDYGTLADGSAYLVMEYIRGEDLRRALARAGRFSPAVAVRLLAEVCSAIEAAHDQGILHRDLKPENILLPQTAVDVKVLDFGVAKILARDDDAPAREAMPTLTLAGQAIGTPAYMAPEQLRGGAVDARTDVFSLGVIAYEMLSGALPFGKGSMVEVAMRQQDGAPAISTIAQTPAPLARAVMSALSHDPQQRPASPTMFAGALKEALKGGPD